MHQHDSRTAELLEALKLELTEGSNSSYVSKAADHLRRAATTADVEDEAYWTHLRDAIELLQDMLLRDHGTAYLGKIAKELFKELHLVVRRFDA